MTEPTKLNHAQMPIHRDREIDNLKLKLKAIEEQYDAMCEDRRFEAAKDILAALQSVPMANCISKVDVAVSRADALLERLEK